MKISIDDLTVKFDNTSADRLVERWVWLVGTDKTPILISAIGDMFLMDRDQKVYWLEVGGGELTLIADSVQAFEEKLTDIEQVEEWFLMDLTTSLRLSAIRLKDGQVYSYKKLPILGGDYTVENFAALDIREHFGYIGDIHKQIKDLPGGTRVQIKTVD